MNLFLIKKKKIMISLVAVFCILGNSIYAQNLGTGTVAVKIVLTDSCIINGDPITGPINFGEIDFGSHPTLFTTATAQLMSGSAGFTVQCSTTTPPKFTLVSGTHDGLAPAGTGTRAMANGPKYVGYDVYLDTLYATPIANGDEFYESLNTGAVETVNLYGRAVGSTSDDPGTYTDTLTISIDF